MAKSSKRQRNKQRQKQVKAKRNWDLDRPSKLRRKSINKVRSSHKILPIGKEASESSCLRTKSTQETNRTQSSRSAKSLASCMMNSLSDRASRPINFLCTCVLLCTNTIHRSFDVVSQGKRRVHTAVACSMVSGYSKVKRVISLCDLYVR